VAVFLPFQTINDRWKTKIIETKNPCAFFHDVDSQKILNMTIGKQKSIIFADK